MIRAQMMKDNPAYDDGDVEITDDADMDVFLLVRSDEVAVLAEQLTRFVRTAVAPALDAPERMQARHRARVFKGEDSGPDWGSLK